MRDARLIYGQILSMNQSKENLPSEGSFDRFQEAEKACPACKNQRLLVFYAITNVPVHSCLLMPTKNAAVTVHKGDMQLGLCKECGFITNTLFDPSAHNYSPQYEETQGFSACFSSFAKLLAQKLINKYDIRNKSILEIGCGKGEFITLLCMLGDSKGVGIDPAFVQERYPREAVGRVEFICDFYSEDYAKLQADVICCRHTLEHIDNVQNFIKMLRGSLGDRKNTLVFFEVPNAGRIIETGAFWDVYYEHCSYFAAGSFARLFSASGFETEDIWLEYDNQYLMLTAYPSVKGPNSAKQTKNDIVRLTKICDGFGKKCRMRIEAWQKRIDECIDRGEKVVVWGSSSNGVSFLTTLNVSEKIKYVVDINPHKHGKFIPGTGQEIVPLEFLCDYQPDKIIVINPIYCNEIQNDIDRLKVKAQLLPIC